MRNSEHLANVMVQAFIDAVNEGIDLVALWWLIQRLRQKLLPLLSNSLTDW